jgi:hypothetical protein
MININFQTFIKFYNINAKKNYNVFNFNRWTKSNHVFDRMYVGAE